MQLLNFLRLIKSKSCKVHTLIYMSFGKQAHQIKSFLVGNDSIRGTRLGCHRRAPCFDELVAAPGTQLKDSKYADVLRWGPLGNMAGTGGVFSHP